jgi:hypothetical protein
MIKGYLWKEMMFGMKLHPTHKDEVKETKKLVISGGGNLVFDEIIFYLVFVTFLTLMVSKKYVGGVETTE